MKNRLHSSIVLSVAGLLMTAAVLPAATYNFQRLDNSADPTFNQLLGVNNTSTIAGYFGVGRLRILTRDIRSFHRRPTPTRIFPVRSRLKWLASIATAAQQRWGFGWTATLTISGLWIKAIRSPQ